MNIWQIVGYVITVILGIGGVGVVVAKYAGKAKKYLHIASEALALLDTVVSAVEDQKIDDLEIAAIKEKAEALMADIKPTTVK